MERRLGRGLGSLLSSPQAGEAAPSSELRVDQIRPNPFQPRTEFDEEELASLAGSIRSHGILQPVAVRRVGQGYELISGERRWRASQLAGLERIPANVLEAVTDDQMLELALVENLQRVDLDPLERARGFARMVEQLGLTQEKVAEKVGLKRATVANHLRLLDLPETVQGLVAQGLLTMGHARALLGIPGDEARTRLAEAVVREDLSVRETEKRVRERAKQSPPSADRAPSKGDEVPPWAVEMQTRMREALGAKVSLRNGAGYRGQIVIDYAGREDLERLYAFLAPRPTVE